MYNEALYHEHGVTAKFVEDDISVSTKGGTRGIHGDAETWKLISCLYGRFYFVVVNCDRESPAFGKWQSFVSLNITVIRFSCLQNSGMGI